MVGEGAGPATGAGDPPQLVENRLALGLGAGPALRVVVVLRMVDVGLEVGEAAPVGGEGAAVGEIAACARSVRRVDEIQHGSGLSFRDPDNIPLEFFAPPS